MIDQPSELSDEIKKMQREFAAWMFRGKELVAIDRNLFKKLMRKAKSKKRTIYEELNRCVKKYLSRD